MPRIPTTEPVPQHYHDNFAMLENAEQDPTIALLEGLRGELTDDSPFRKRTIESLYSVTRSIGDSELLTSDTTASVNDILSESRWYARPIMFEDTLNHPMPNVVGTHNYNGTYSIQRESVESLATGLVKHMNAIHNPFKQPSDGVLLTAIRVGAHEAGHALLSGIGKLARSHRMVEDSRLAATKLYLSKHPERGLTKNWEMDVASDEERFADGYAWLVMQHVMKTLGYDETTTDYVIGRTGPEGAFGFDSTYHVLDFIDHFSADTSLQNLLPKEEGVDGSKQYLYPGQLGYAFPLSRSSLTEELQFLAQQLRDGDLLQVPNKVEWESAVQANQSPKLKVGIEYLKLRRAAALQSMRHPLILESLVTAAGVDTPTPQ